MPPKVTFAKEDVFQAAYEIAEENGIKVLTARRIAERLNSSTAPVYSCYSSMDELKNEILRKSRDVLFEYMIQPYTERPFLNMGTGYAIFAREHKKLFQSLFLESSAYKDILDELIKSLEKEMIRDSRFSDMSVKDRNELLNTMWTFTHGMATLICLGFTEKTGNKHIIDKLSGVGALVIPAALAKSRKK